MGKNAPRGVTKPKGAHAAAPVRALAVFGHSHVECFTEPLADGTTPLGGATGVFPATNRKPKYQAKQTLGRASARVNSTKAMALALYLHGNMAATSLLFTKFEPIDLVVPGATDLPMLDSARLVPYEAVYQTFQTAIAPTFAAAAELVDAFDMPVVHLEAPPPAGPGKVRSQLAKRQRKQQRADYLSSSAMQELLKEHSLSADKFRFSDGLIDALPLTLAKLWRVQQHAIRDACGQLGIAYIPVPESTFTDDGLYLRDELVGDLTHGNEDFARLYLEHLATLDLHATTSHENEHRSTAVAATANPYQSQPDKAYWSRAVAGPNAVEVDPVAESPLTITPETKIATAGSCFAQNIARYLDESGFSYFVTEEAPQLLGVEQAAVSNYGTYSARFGNIYTARQLRQPIERATTGGSADGRAPSSKRDAEVWFEGPGLWIDPFRPQIQPGGFATRSELEQDRKYHLGAVRRMLEELDVFVFTLGLTESWENQNTGAVYPVCPGVSGGTFDPELHTFQNYTSDEVTADLVASFDALRQLNPNAQIVLTVSPVPLIATATDAHVLSATTYSKSVLRVAAEQMATQYDDIMYFPSYEVIMSPFNRGGYFADDLRSVTDEGVHHAMTLFFRHYANHELGPAGERSADTKAARQARKKAVAREVVCDLEALEEQMNPDSTGP